MLAVLWTERGDFSDDTCRAITGRVTKDDALALLNFGQDKTDQRLQVRQMNPDTSAQCATKRTVVGKNR